MGSSHDLFRIEQAIRRAVLTDSFHEASRLLQQYGEELEEVLRANPAELPILHSCAQDLFEWSTQLVRSSREEAASNAVRLRLLCDYRRTPHSPSRINAEA